MNKIKVLFFVPHPIQDAGSRYRIYQYLPILERNGFQCDVRPFSTLGLFEAIRNGGSLLTKISHTLFCTARRALEIGKVSNYDLIFIHREVYPFFAPRAEQMVLRRHRRIVFGLDDAVYVGHDRKALKYSWLYRFKYGPGRNEVFAGSNLVIAASSCLAEHVRKFTPRVAVIPTVIDLERYPFSHPSEIMDRRITIGWYGSNSTSPYLKPIVPALQRLANEHPGRLRFSFYGDQRLTLPLHEAEVYPFRLETEIEDLRSMDIGIMPLPDTEWTRAKAGFKAIQYMALGIPTVVTPLGMSTELVRNEENGLHAGTVDEWFAQLDRLVRDLELRQRLAVAGRKRIEEEYSLQRWGPKFVDCLWSAYEGKVASADRVPGNAAAFGTEIRSPRSEKPSALPQAKGSADTFFGTPKRPDLAR
jgi:glycosyltransferase involved in cell wall biosynthesis